MEIGYVSVANLLPNQIYKQVRRASFVPQFGKTR